MGNILRIAHILGSVAKGGVESVVFNYYKFINKSKIQFDFIIDENSPYDIPSEVLALGCRVYKIPPYNNTLAYIDALKDIFIKGKYRIVHSHMNTLSVFALYAAKKAGVPVRIAHSHSTAGIGKGEFYRNILKYILRNFSKIYPTHLVACSEYAGKWLFGNDIFNNRTFKVFNNAIDDSKFIYNQEIRNQVRSSLGIENNFVIGHVGRFSPQKNHAFLVDIFNRIYNEDATSLLLLVGEGELKKQIEDKVNRLNLQNNVMFLGSRSDVNELYQGMDVFIFPSLYEGLPVVIVETQMARLHAIVSDRVTREAKFSDFIKFISLHKSEKVWAESALKKKPYNRDNVLNHPNMENYIIKNEALKLEDYYYSSLKSLNL